MAEDPEKQMKRIRNKIRRAKDGGVNPLKNNPPAVKGDKHKHHSFTDPSLQEDDYNPKHSK